MNLLRITILALFSLLIAESAVARPIACAGTDVMRPCGANSLGWATTVTPGRQFRTHGPDSGAGWAQNRGSARQIRAYGGSVVAHPAGCPRRAFCGCGASVRVFGHSVRSLWLAANWLRFPRTAPAPGMVAARRGHVFVLESHVGGSTWIVYDANSGGRQTRIHARSLAGYAVVNPHA